MQTVYYTTANYIRHTGNVVNLEEYRRRLERVAAPVMESSFEAAKMRASSRVRRVSRGGCPGLFLDFCASTAIVAMTLVVVIQFLVLK